MKNTEVSRKVLKAITIGLAAAMAMMPTVTAFADDGEGSGDGGSSSHSESSDSGSHDSDSHDSDSHEDHSEHTDDVESSHDDVEDAADEVRDEESGGDESGGGEESHDDGGSGESGGGEESHDDGGSGESGGGEESHDDGGSGESGGGEESHDDGGSGESGGGETPAEAPAAEAPAAEAPATEAPAAEAPAAEAPAAEAPAAEAPAAEAPATEAPAAEAPAAEAPAAEAPAAEAPAAEAPAAEAPAAEAPATEAPAAEAPVAEAPAAEAPAAGGGASGDEAVNVPEMTGATGDEAVNVPELLGASPTDATGVIENEINNEAGAIGTEEVAGAQAGTGEETGGYQSVSEPLSDAAGSLKNIVDASAAVDKAFADAAKVDAAAVKVAEGVEKNEFLAVFNDWTMPSAENAVKTADTEVNTNIGVTVKQDVSEAASAGYENKDAADTAKTEAQTQLDKAVGEANRVIDVAKTDLGSAKQALDNAESQLKEAQEAKVAADNALDNAKEKFKKLLEDNGLSWKKEGDTIKAVGDISKLDELDGDIKGDIKAAIVSAAKAVDNAKSNARKAAYAVEYAKDEVDKADANFSKAGIDALTAINNDFKQIIDTYETAKDEKDAAESEKSEAERAKENADDDLKKAEKDLTSAQNIYDTALDTHQKTYDEAHASIYETIDSKLTNVGNDFNKNRALAFYFTKLYLIDIEDAKAESIEVDKDNQPSIDKKTGIVTSIGNKKDGGFKVNYITKSNEQKSLVFNWLKYDDQGTCNDKLGNDYDTYKVVLVKDGKNTDTVLGEIKLDRDDSKTVTGKSITVGDSKDNKLDLISYLSGYNDSKDYLQTLSDKITEAEGKVTEAGENVTAAGKELEKATNKYIEVNARYQDAETANKAVEAARMTIGAITDLNENANVIRDILAGSKGEDETDEAYKDRVQDAYDAAKKSAEKANTGYKAISNSYNVLSSLIEKIKSQQETVGKVKVKEGNNIQESYKEFRKLASLLTQYKLMQELKQQGVDLSTVEMKVRENSDESVWWRTGQGSKNNYGEITYKIGDEEPKKFYFDYLALDEKGEHVLDQPGLKNTSSVKTIVVVSNTDAYGQLSLGWKFDERTRYIDENAYQSMFDDLSTDLSYAKLVRDYASAVVEYGKMMKIQKTAEYAQQRVDDAAKALVNASYDQSVSTAKIKQLEGEFEKAQQKYNDANTKYKDVKGDLENLKAEIDKIIESGFKVKDGSGTEPNGETGNPVITDGSAPAITPEIGNQEPGTPAITDDGNGNNNDDNGSGNGNGNNNDDNGSGNGNRSESDSGSGSGSDGGSGSGSGSGSESIESASTSSTSSRTRTRSRSGGGDDDSAASEVDGSAAADTGAPAAETGAPAAGGGVTTVAAAETAAPGAAGVTTYTGTADGAFTDAGAPAPIGAAVTLEAGGGAVDGGAVLEDGGAPAGAVLEDAGAPAGAALGDTAAPAGAVEAAGGALVDGTNPVAQVLGDKANPVAQVLGERLAPIVEAVENGTFNRNMVLNDDVKASIPFGWWLLIFILGATGVKMYMDHRKRKEEEAAKQGR